MATVLNTTRQLERGKALIAKTFRSDSRNSNVDSPSKYTVEFETPVTRADSMQMGTSVLPVRNIYNVTEQRQLIPIGTPYVPSRRASFPNNELKLAVSVDYYTIASEMTKFDEVQALNSTLTWGSTTTTNILFPRKINKIVGATGAVGDLIHLTTEFEHGLYEANRWYDTLNLAVRIVGANFDTGIPEIMGTPWNLSALLQEKGIAAPIITILSSTQFSIKNTFLDEFTSVSDNTADNARHTSRFISSTGGIVTQAYLNADMPTISELMSLFNKEFKYQYDQTKNGSTPFPQLQFQYHLNDTSSSHEHLTMQLQQVCSLEENLILNISKLNLDVVDLDIQNYIFNGKIISRTKFTTTDLQTDLGIQKDQYLYQNANVLNRHEIESFETIKNIKWSISQTYIVSGGPFRKDIVVRSGRYETAASLAVAVSNRLKGLSFSTSEAPILRMIDVSENEAIIRLPSGSYTAEQLAFTLTQYIQNVTDDTQFDVSVVNHSSSSSSVLNIPDSESGSLVKPFPRRTKFIIRHKGNVTFGFRPQGSWMRRCGFMRMSYRGMSAYTSEEWVYDSGIEHDMLCLAVNDGESDMRLQLTTAPNGYEDNSASTPVGSTASVVSGLHRCRPLGVETTPAADLAAKKRWLLTTTMESDENNRTKYHMGKLLPGDVIIMKYPPSGGSSSTRIVTAIVSEAFDVTNATDVAELPDTVKNSVTTNLHWPIKIMRTPSVEALLPDTGGSDWFNITFCEPLNNNARFQLLWGLSPDTSIWSLMGYKPSIYPNWEGLFSDIPQGTSEKLLKFFGSQIPTRNPQLYESNKLIFGEDVLDDSASLIVRRDGHDRDLQQLLASGDPEGIGWSPRLIETTLPYYNLSLTNSIALLASMDVASADGNQPVLSRRWMESSSMPYIQTYNHILVVLNVSGALKNSIKNSERHVFMYKGREYIILANIYVHSATRHVTLREPAALIEFNHDGIRGVNIPSLNIEFRNDTMDLVDFVGGEQIITFLFTIIQEEHK
jgi:hypothetical protein